MNAFTDYIFIIRLTWVTSHFKNSSAGDQPESEGGSAATDGRANGHQRLGKQHHLRSARRRPAGHLRALYAVFRRPVERERTASGSSAAVRRAAGTAGDPAEPGGGRRRTVRESRQLQPAARSRQFRALSGSTAEVCSSVIELSITYVICLCNRTWTVLSLYDVSKNVADVL